MGRGLSPMQQWILRRAGEITCVYFPDVMEGWYTFRPERPLRRHSEQHYDPEKARREPYFRGWPGSLIHPSGQFFNPKQIGEKRYTAARVATLKAFARLEQRGFVERVRGRWANWSGVELTTKGKEYLSANRVTIVVPC